jgi:hypothetical protein
MPTLIKTPNHLARFLVLRDALGEIAWVRQETAPAARPGLRG